MGIPFLAIVLIGITAYAYAEEPERLVGGREAVLGEFPYQAALWQNDIFSCGACIISHRHVLTAAHCVYGQTAAPYDDLLVYTGSVTSGEGENHTVKDVHAHPDYSPHSSDSYIHDIAVIQLREWMTTNEYQMPIGIATYDPPDQAVVQLSGYGRIGTTLPYPTILQKANMTVITNENCQSHMKETIYDTQLCTLDAVNHGACSGDSGGPLAYNNKLVGIVSWSYPCAHGVPDVYTRVFKYRDFIFNTVDRMKA